jgi:hypothetical protein
MVFRVGVRFTFRGHPRASPWAWGTETANLAPILGTMPPTEPLPTGSELRARRDGPSTVPPGCRRWRTRCPAMRTRTRKVARLSDGWAGWAASRHLVEIGQRALPVQGCGQAACLRGWGRYPRPGLGGCSGLSVRRVHSGDRRDEILLELAGDRLQEPSAASSLPPNAGRSILPLAIASSSALHAWQRARREDARWPFPFHRGGPRLLSPNFHHVRGHDLEGL